MKRRASDGRRLAKKPRGLVMVTRPLRSIRSRVGRSPEVKHVDYALSAGFGSVSTVGVCLDFLGYIRQGITDAYRIGDKFFVKSIKIDGIVAGGALDTIADDAFNTIRISVVQSNATATGAPYNLMFNSGYTLGQSLQSIPWPCEVRTIKDDFFHFENGVGRTGYTPAGWRYTMYHRFPGAGLEVRCPRSGAGDNWNSTQLYMIMMTDSVGGVNPGFTAGYASIAFTDA